MMNYIKTAASAILTATLILGACVLIGQIEGYYIRDNCWVVENKGGYTTITDRTGYEYTFKGDFYKVGAKVKAKLATNGTDNVTDDTIVWVKGIE